VAIIKLGALVAGIRGTVGGVTYTAGKSGPYARAWAKGANSRRQGQQLTRGRFSALGTAWQGLTASQRSGWDTLAAADPEPTYNSLGELEVLSGWQYFLRVNARRLKTVGTIVEDAATGSDADRPDPCPILDFSVDVSGGGTDLLEWDDSSAPADSVVVFFCTVRPTLASAYVPPRAKYVIYRPADLGSFAIAAFIEKVFGTLQPGWLCVGQLYCQSEFGLRSTVETETVGVT